MMVSSNLRNLVVAMLYVPSLLGCERPHPLIADPAVWEKFEFSGRKLTQVTVRYCVRPPTLQEDCITVEVTDRQSLADYERALGVAMVIGSGLTSTAVTPGNAMGEIEFVATDGKFSVFVLEAGFFLESNFYRSDRMFFSWTLAKLLDRIVRENTGESLPQALLDNMIGDTIRMVEQRELSQ